MSHTKLSQSFKGLIATHPDLLAGEQLDSDDPVRWMLVRSEAGVPDEEGSGNRWSIDHLLLDQHGRPTFVEVKRSSDSRIRREVVGQMLDYAANAQAYWPVNRIRSLAAEAAGGEEQLSEKVMQLLSINELQEGSQDVEEYWQTVDDNLRSGNLRLMFVADEIPRELRRIIEFLNEHMPRIEVAGIEIRQYSGSKIRAIVPRVVGQTERAKSDKGLRGSQRRTSIADFLNACPDEHRVIFDEVLQTAKRSGYFINWGTKGFSVRVPNLAGQLQSILFCYPPGTVGKDIAFVEVYLKDIANSKSIREELSKIEGVNEKGQYTLELRLDDTGSNSIGHFLKIVWQLGESLSQNNVDS